MSMYRVEEETREGIIYYIIYNAQDEVIRELQSKIKAITHCNLLNNMPCIF